MPGLTGAADVMDLQDLKPVFDALGVRLENEKVLDVGCGTGRLKKACKGYFGVDISPSMVAYCVRAGIPARVITGPKDITGSYDWVTCLSVFTHIPRSERQAYLSAFRVAPNLLVDILPGEEGGSVGSWFANVEDFQFDLECAGWWVLGTHAQRSPDGAYHEYYRCSRL